ncbi:hypothetical protein AC623_10125 [Bacillus sp. FJAT-27231]|nr:hypothetical protein AC623_10125 [Bacillus sp. FJAT-27231]
MPFKMPNTVAAPTLTPKIFSICSKEAKETNEILNSWLKSLNLNSLSAVVTKEKLFYHFHIQFLLISLQSSIEIALSVSTRSNEVSNFFNDT